MHEILYEYDMNPTTWAYLSSLLTIGIYFKFRRFWSVRNLDLVALICLAPGLLLISHHKESLGYLWLFSVSGFFLVRLLVDPVMVRRPLLEPNLSAGAMVFAGAALLVFLIANVINHPNGGPETTAPLSTTRLPATHPAPVDAGPELALFRLLLRGTGPVAEPADMSDPQQRHRQMIREAMLRSLAILGHLAVVIGMLWIGYRHFDSIKAGMAAATLYLFLPYTAQMAADVDHVVPAALLVWGVAAYRRPILAGFLLGWAAGVIYYPLLLLPLWCAFYWSRGLLRFAVGLGIAAALLALLVGLSPGSWQSYVLQFQQMISRHPGSGFWHDHEAVYRIPVLAAYVVLCASLAVWPPQKNLGTLLSCSAAVMLGAQFWHAPHGGLYMAWYLPLLILTIFRPNLEDRLAITAVSERLFSWRSQGRS